MKQLIKTGMLAAALCTSTIAVPTHLDIMVPDIKDTDLHGPVKSVELKICHIESGEYSTERNKYDRVGNLVKTSETDEAGKLMETTEFFYDENGCYTRMLYNNKEKKYTTEWKVILNPETRQIALRQLNGNRIGIETYSPEGYLVSYQLLDENKKQLLFIQYKRDEHNRRLKKTRTVERKPAYTLYYKWADNGFIDMERLIYHQEKAKRLHTYEYLVTDEHGNWTQRIMVRYDDAGKKPVKVYEQTVQRKIEYYEDEEPVEAATETEPAEAGDADTEAETGATEGE